MDKNHKKRRRKFEVREDKEIIQRERIKIT